MECENKFFLILIVNKARALTRANCDAMSYLSVRIAEPVTVLLMQVKREKKRFVESRTESALSSKLFPT